MKKEELKNIFQTLSEKDYYSNADFHIHSTASDGEMTAEEIITQAKERNKKYISICDHNCADVYISGIESEQILIPGIEFDCYYKFTMIHILGYGADTKNPELQKLYAKSTAGKKHTLYRLLKLRNPSEVIDKIHSAGGIAVLAHPCRYPAFNFDNFIKELKDLGLDGLETYYEYRGLKKLFKFRSKKSVILLADKYNLIKTGGSDSHDKSLYERT